MVQDNINEINSNVTFILPILKSTLQLREKHFWVDKRQLKVKENRNEDTGTYLNTNTSDDHEYQVLIFPEPVGVIYLNSGVTDHF